jgi:hypothetical protein
MEAHAVPRQITTFEFKLIGFLTLNQFIYLLFTTGIALVMYYGIPIPIVNVFFTAIVVAGGFAIAFVPINERPMDVWIRNFFKKLMSASQYYYIKNNPPPDCLKNIQVSSPTIQKLESSTVMSQSGIYKQEPSTPTLITVQPTPTTPSQQPVVVDSIPQTPLENISVDLEKKTITSKTEEKTTNNPFLWGTIKNNQEAVLPNILTYIKNSEGKVLRLLKTNNKGVFATYHPLDAAEYYFEIKDPENKYFFDTMKLKVLENNEKPFNFRSKEII